MRIRSFARVVLVIALVGFAGAPNVTGAQQQGQQAQTPQSPQKPEPPAPVPVRLKIVVERSESDKPVISIPFEIVVRANTNDNTSLNHGRSVPIQQTTFLPMAAGGVATMPQVSTVYQSIGSNYNIRSVKLTDKILTFEMMIDLSFLDPSTTSNAANPTFRKFSMQFYATTRLGETSVVAVSTDRTTNETAKVSVFADLVR